MAAINRELQQYMTSLANNQQQDSLHLVFVSTQIGNQYIQEQDPYKLVNPRTVTIGDGGSLSDKYCVPGWHYSRAVHATDGSLHRVVL